MPPPARPVRFVHRRNEWRARRACSGCGDSMKGLGAVHLVGITLAALTLCACALARAPQPFSKHDWKIARVSCPAGCAEATMRFLRAQVGHSVNLSATSLDAPFLDKCEGTVRWELRDSASAAVIEELNRGIAPGAKRLSVADLETVQPGPIGNGVAMCGGRYGELPMARAPL